jgi:hypothetical protein
MAVVTLGGKNTQAAKQTVTNQESVTISFSSTFSSIPKVVATLESSVGSVECFLSNITTSGFTANFSSLFSGEVHYIAIED